MEASNLLEILRKKYGVVDDTRDQSQLYAKTASGGRIDILFIGEEKVIKTQQIEVLFDCTVENEHISSVQDVASMIPNLQRLTFNYCDIDSWDLVKQLIEECKRLKELIFLGKVPPLPVPFEFTTSTSLTTLSFTDCNMSWTDILQFRNLPSLTTLIVPKNHISTFFSPESREECPGFTQLKSLSVGENEIVDWQQILYFSHLPNLTELFADENLIETISFPQDQLFFPKLEELWLNKNPISSWSSIEALASIPSLVHLRLKNTPVLLVKTPLSFGIAPTRINTQGLGADAYWGPPPETMEQVKEKENRVMILFYLGNLNTLNGSAITQKEKRMVKRMKEDLLEEQKEREEQKLQNVEEDPQPAPVSLPTTTTLPSATGMVQNDVPLIPATEHISEPPRPAKSKKDAKATFLKNMQRNRTQKT